MRPVASKKLQQPRATENSSFLTTDATGAPGATDATDAPGATDATDAPGATEESARTAGY